LFANPAYVVASIRGKNMGHDPLDKETSVGVDLTPTGLKANAKSRFVAAIDRLCGNIVDLPNIPLERRLGRERAKIAGEQQLIEAIAKHAVERMDRDEEFAERVTRNYLGSIFSRQDNKDAVVRKAVDDLRRDPIGDEQAHSGQPDLDPLFLNKLERHAEDASTEALQEKWGRVLAAEVRKPGLISPKVMRIVDEIEQVTAKIFEDLCGSRLDNVIPKCLVAEIVFADLIKLVGSSLLVDPGLTGQVRTFIESGTQGGRKIWIMPLHPYAVAFPQDAALPTPNDDPHRRSISLQNNAPVMGVYVLTDEGRAVSEILPDRKEDALSRLIAKMSADLPSTDILVYDHIEGTNWRPRVR
jgi:hypothetical protein